MGAEQELLRQKRVQQWQEYFDHQLMLQQKRLEQIREKQRQLTSKPSTKIDLSSIGDAQPMFNFESASPRDSELSEPSTLASNVSQTIIDESQARWIIKCVLSSVDKGLPTIQEAIATFQMSNGRDMTDLEITALIHRLNTQGRRGSVLNYDKDTGFFVLTGGIGDATIRFQINDHDMSWRRAHSDIHRRKTPMPIQHKPQPDPNEALIASTVKALSIKCVRDVFRRCGLRMRYQEISDVALAVLNSLSDSENMSQSSVSTQSTCMHEVADKFIVELLGLDDQSETTDPISKPSTDENSARLHELLDEDNLNVLALEIVGKALRDDPNYEGSEVESVSSKQKTSNEINKRINCLTTSVVKKAVKDKFSATSDHSSQELPSQDVEYLEKRVSNIALRIIDNLSLKESRKTPDLRKLEEVVSEVDPNSRPVSGISKASTLPSDYDTRCNEYTARIIETLLRLKSIMPHPKPSRKNANITPIAAIAKCINFDALYKAPKQAFQLDQTEIKGLAQALADKIDDLDQKSTTEDERPSPRDGAIADLTEKLYDPKISPRSDITSDSSASKVAFKVVENALRKGNFTIAPKALSDGGESLAGVLIDENMNKAQKFATEVTEKALDDMALHAKSLADELLKTTVVSDTEESSCDDIADRLAGLIVDYGEEKYLKESLANRAEIMQNEVGAIAKELIHTQFGKIFSFF